MEDTGLRIPHILEQIYDLIDNESLIKCKGASRKMCSIVENFKCGKFLTTRIIQCYFKNPVKFGKDWRIVFQKLPAERLSEFEILVKDFYTAFPSRFEEDWSPLHIAAERGHLDFCKFIAKVSVTKSFKWPPLLFSAQAGHLEVSRYLYTEIYSKTPTNGPCQITAQHLAAKNGHLEIYQFLHENTNDINPVMQEDITPLHLAAQGGHFDVCKYICDNTMMVAPERNDGMTPLFLAQHRFKFKVSNLLGERDTNANIVAINIDELMRSILYYAFYCTCIFIAIDFFQYLFSGVSMYFNGPIEFLYLCLYIFICVIFPVMVVLIITIPMILCDIVKDVRFSCWTGPKLEY